MPPKSKPLYTFQGWLNELLGLPKYIFNESYAVVKKQNGQILLFRADAWGPQTPSDEYLSALIGDELEERKTISTNVDLRDLVDNPVETLKKVGQSTISEITFINDITETRRRDIAGKLIKDDIQPEDEKPDNLMISFLSGAFQLPVSKDATGKTRSNLKTLSKDPDTGEYEDRYNVEEGHHGDVSGVESYKELGGAFQSLAGSTLQAGPRSSSKTMADESLMRATAVELYGPDSVMTVLGQRGRKTAKSKRAESSLKNYFKTNGGNIDKLVRNENELSKVMGIEVKNMSETEKRFLKQWLRSEKLRIQASGWDADKPFTPPEKVLDRWDKAGLDDKIDTPLYKDKKYGKIKKDKDGKVIRDKKGNAQADLGFRANFLEGDLKAARQNEAQKGALFIKENQAEFRAVILKRTKELAKKNQAAEKKARQAQYLAYQQAERELINERIKAIDALALTDKEIEQQAEEAHKYFLRQKAGDPEFAKGGFTLSKLQELKKEALANKKKFIDTLKRSSAAQSVLLNTVDRAELARQANEIGKQVYDSEMQQFASGKASRALKRFNTAINVSDYAEQLFIASVTTDLLRAIGEGKTINQLIFASRLLGAVPGMPFRSAKELLSPATLRKLPFINDLTKQDWLVAIANRRNPIKVVGSVAAKNFLSFEKNELPWTAKQVSKFIGEEPFRSKVFVSFRVEGQTAKEVGALKNLPIINKMPIAWRHVALDANEASGIFGQYGIIDLIENAGARNQLLNKVGLVSAPKQLLADLSPNGQLGSFYQKFFSIINKDSIADLHNITDSNKKPFIALAQELGFIKFDKDANIYRFITKSDGDVVKNVGLEAFEKFYKNYDEFFKKGKGAKLFKKLEEMGLDPNKRWAFLSRIVSTGKVDQFTNKFAGMLTTYNRTANAIQSFYLKNFIFNEKLVNVALIGKPLGGVQGLLRRMGMSDEIGLIGAISTWKIMRMMKIFRDTRRMRLLLTFSKASGKTFYRSLLQKALTNNTLRLILARLGIVVSGAVTGGIAFAVGLLGGAAWKFFKGLITFRPRKGAKEAWEELKKLLNIFLKLIYYPIRGILVCGCSLYLILIILMLSLLSLTFKDNNFVSGEGIVVPGFEESCVEVVKLANYTSGTNRIEYTITVTNGCENEVILANADDRLSFHPSCESGEDTVEYGEFGFPGIYDEPLDLTPLQGVALTAGESITIEFSIQDTIESTEDGSYVNTIEIQTTGNEGVTTVSDTVRTDIGEGGCFTCPSGWPMANVQPIIQGPGGSFSHQRLEALDFAPGGAPPIFATHDGVATVNKYNNCTPTSTENYGCHVVIESLDGNYWSIYAHMVDIPDWPKTGDMVKKGDQIGIMGNTGFSTGPHLHYEFRDREFSVGRPLTYQCLPNEPLRMENVTGDQYTPPYSL